MFQASSAYWLVLTRGSSVFDMGSPQNLLNQVIRGFDANNAHFNVHDHQWYLFCNIVSFILFPRIQICIA
jgi:hypothetical protein